LAVKVDLLEHKKSQVDQAFEILGSIAAEVSVEKLKEIRKKIGKLKDVKLPKELSYEKLLAKVNALDNLKKAIDDEPKKPVTIFGDADTGFLTNISKCLKALQDLIPEDNDVNKKVALTGANLNDEQIAAYKKLKDDANRQELALLIKQALLQDDEENRWSISFSLTDEEENEIKGADSKERLKDIQKKFREIRSN